MKLADWQAWAILSGAEKCKNCRMAKPHYPLCLACLGLRYWLYGDEHSAFLTYYVRGEL